jgi:hypothetical protein
MTSKQIRELKKIGKAIEVKVTLDFNEKEPVVNIRDYQFRDVVQAQLYLHNIAITELPENYEQRIG